MAMSDTDRLVWQLYAQLGCLKIRGLPELPEIEEGEKAFRDWAKQALHTLNGFVVFDGLGI